MSRRRLLVHVTVYVSLLAGVVSPSVRAADGAAGPNGQCTQEAPITSMVGSGDPSSEIASCDPVGDAQRQLGALLRETRGGFTMALDPRTGQPRFY